MNNDRINIKTENTMSDLIDNLHTLKAQTVKHEQCSLAAQTLINYNEDIEGINDDLTAMIQYQSEDINALVNFVTQQAVNIEK